MADTTIKSDNTFCTNMQRKSLQEAIKTLRSLNHEHEVCESVLDSVENMLSTCNCDSGKYVLERVKWVKAKAADKPRGFWAVIDMLCAELEAFINS